MNLLLLHGSGWDELLLIGGAIFLAYLAVRFTSRGGDDEPTDADVAEAPAGDRLPRSSHPDQDQ